MKVVLEAVVVLEDQRRTDVRGRLLCEPPPARLPSEYIGRDRLDRFLSSDDSLSPAAPVTVRARHGLGG